MEGPSTPANTMVKAHSPALLDRSQHFNCASTVPWIAFLFVVVELQHCPTTGCISQFLFKEPTIAMCSRKTFALLSQSREVSEIRLCFHDSQRFHCVLQCGYHISLISNSQTLLTPLSFHTTFTTSGIYFFSSFLCNGTACAFPYLLLGINLQCFANGPNHVMTPLYTSTLQPTMLRVLHAWIHHAAVIGLSIRQCFDRFEPYSFLQFSNVVLLRPP